MGTASSVTGIEFRARIIVRHSYDDYLYYASMVEVRRRQGASTDYMESWAQVYRSRARAAAFILSGAYPPPMVWRAQEPSAAGR